MTSQRGAANIIIDMTECPVIQDEGAFALESDKKGIMDTKWHDQVIEHTWAKARARHRELVKQFMEDGWKEQNGLTMEEAHSWGAL